MNWLRHLFSTEYMVEKKWIKGDLVPSGEAYRASLAIALPAIAEMVSISVIGMADTAMVGRLGTYAIAAVGLTGQPRLIFLSFFMALNVGVTVIVSRRRGEGDPAAANLCLRQSLMIGLALGAIVSVLAVVLAEPVLLLAGAQDDTIGAAVAYFQVIGAGLIFQILSMIICAAQRGVGNTKITMYVNIAANIVNVIFNYFLIGGHWGFPRLEVRGAAIATVMGGAVGFGLAAASLFNGKGYLRVSRNDSWRLDLPVLKILGRLGGGSMIEQLAARFGFFIFVLVVARLGTDAFAAHQIASQLMNLSFTFADGIGVATTSLVGLNLGKKRPDLSVMYGQIGQRIALLAALFLAALSFAGRNWFPWLFTEDPRIVALSGSLIIILAVIQPVQTSQIVMAGSLRGAGDTRFVAVTMLLTVTVIRPVTSFLLIYVVGLGAPGAWLAILFDQIVRLALVYHRFLSGKWMRIKI
ncbi:MAG: MATE family efflux transporter [Clostridiales bacterium]|nr:MATE family efflux transporter [Clostridiales bacterium]